jgi:photosystem II stability/assembly factor-like uncharacterized protein
VVAVGQRGHIVYSDDAGKSWTQASVPVSSDLVAVSFPTPEKGWAVGHDGVVLHSADAGKTWQRQLDGHLAGKLMADRYAELAAKNELGSADKAATLLGEAKRMAGQGAEIPFLDVWFADQNNGFVVGAFNLIFHTSDGGKNWEPWFHRTDNPNRLHLYAVRPIGADVYITGEQGLVMKLDAASGNFVASDTGYRGTFFGATGNTDAVLVYGLRGNAFRSSNGGRSWQKIETGLQDALTGAAACNNHRLVLVSQAGRVLVSDDTGLNFRPIKLEQTTPGSAVACLPGDAAVIAGARGVRTQALK